MQSSAKASPQGLPTASSGEKDHVFTRRFPIGSGSYVAGHPPGQIYSSSTYFIYFGHVAPLKAWKGHGSDIANFLLGTF